MQQSSMRPNQSTTERAVPRKRVRMRQLQFIPNLLPLLRQDSSLHFSLFQLVQQTSKSIRIIFHNTVISKSDHFSLGKFSSVLSIIFKCFCGRKFEVVTWPSSELLVDVIIPDFKHRYGDLRTKDLVLWIGSVHEVIKHCSAGIVSKNIKFM